MITLPPTALTDFIDDANKSYALGVGQSAIVRVVDDVVNSSQIFRSVTAPSGMSSALVEYVLNGTGILRIIVIDSNSAYADKQALDPLTIQEMVHQLNSEGLSVSNLATIFGVSRPTIYSWIEGNVPQAVNKQARVETIFRLLKGMNAQDRRILPKVWIRRSNETIPSIYEVLTAANIDPDAFDAALDATKPLFAKMANRAERPIKSVSALVNETLASNVPNIETWDRMPSIGKEWAGGEGI